MQNFGIQFAPANSQIHCLAHIVNLVVQKLLAMLDDAPDPDVTDDYLPNKDLPLHYDPDKDPEVLAMEQEVFKDGEMGPDEDEAVGLLAGLTSTFESLSPLQKVSISIPLYCCSDVIQLHTTATKICSSPQRRKRFRDMAARVYENKLAPSGRKLASLMVVRDVRHRWNYTHAMIKQLASLNLNTTEWELLEKLGNLLEMFTNVTKQMSHSSIPTLPWVLPLYIGMRAHLRSSRDDSTLPASLRSAATAALEKLEGYFSKACDSQLNIISTLLHPSFGIKFFRKIESDTHLLSAARAQVLFEHVYESYKRTYATDSSQPNAPVASRQQGTFGSFLDNICMVNVDVPEISPVAPMSEINRFWDAFANYDGDSNAPLLWWKVMLGDSVCISQLLTDPAHIDPRIGVSDHFKNGARLSRHSWHQHLSRAAVFKCTSSMPRVPGILKASHNPGSNAHQDVDQGRASQDGVIGVWPGLVLVTALLYIIYMP
ncbi:hypothetical protein B0H14DRAFT_2379796 [Mycena olivaceomarginata]|nr:hypothetical protein B0H14DRAFT_2379796 [Mycena olivaceomarginata]